MDLLKKSSFTDKIKFIFQKKNASEQDIKTLETLLINSDFGYKLSKQISDQAKNLTHLPINELMQSIQQSLEDKLKEFEGKIDFSAPPIENSTPKVIILSGVNGSGKTTTAAKLMHKIKNNNQSAIAIAADTFRAAAVEQLKQWGEKINFEVYSDPNVKEAAALVFKGLEYAIDNNINWVIIDTAGRLNNKTNLMQELAKLEKIVRKKIKSNNIYSFLVLDATTGQNSLNQVIDFKKNLNINGLILNKIDTNSQGGFIIKLLIEQQVKCFFLGDGERITNIKSFNLKNYLSEIKI